MTAYFGRVTTAESLHALSQGAEQVTGMPQVEHRRRKKQKRSKENQDNAAARPCIMQRKIEGRKEEGEVARHDGDGHIDNRDRDRFRHESLKRRKNDQATRDRDYVTTNRPALFNRKEERRRRVYKDGLGLLCDDVKRGDVRHMPPTNINLCK